MRAKGKSFKLQHEPAYLIHSCHQNTSGQPHEIYSLLIFYLGDHSNDKSGMNNEMKGVTLENIINKSLSHGVLQDNAPPYEVLWPQVKYLLHRACEKRGENTKLFAPFSPALLPINQSMATPVACTVAL